MTVFELFLINFGQCSDCFKLWNSKYSAGDGSDSHKIKTFISSFYSGSRIVQNH